MLRSNSKCLGNHVVSPEEEKERLQWEGFAEKEACSNINKNNKNRKLNHNDLIQPEPIRREYFPSQLSMCSIGLKRLRNTLVCAFVLFKINSCFYDDVTGCFHPKKVKVAHTRLPSV